MAFQRNFVGLFFSSSLFSLLYLTVAMCCAVYRVYDSVLVLLWPNQLCWIVVRQCGSWRPKNRTDKLKWDNDYYRKSGMFHNFDPTHWIRLWHHNNVSLFSLALFVGVCVCVCQLVGLFAAFLVIYIFRLDLLAFLCCEMYMQRMASFYISVADIVTYLRYCDQKRQQQ